MYHFSRCIIGHVLPLHEINSSQDFSNARGAWLGKKKKKELTPAV